MERDFVLIGIVFPSYFGKWISSKQFSLLNKLFWICLGGQGRIRIENTSSFPNIPQFNPFYLTVIWDEGWAKSHEINQTHPYYADWERRTKFCEGAQ